jgi:tRNA dimethylallyltransferase
MPDTTPRWLVALYGPTSAGKTRASVDLCLRIRDELGLEPMVVSADSRQVYRYMDIGTSKTTPEEMRGIPHTMIDVTEPVRRLELEKVRRRGQAAHGRLLGVRRHQRVRALPARGLGGRRGRRGAQRRPPGLPAEHGRGRVRRTDPARPKAAGKIHENTYDAIVNALAHAMGNDADRTGTTVAGRPVVLGVDRPAAEIDQRVAATYDEQVRRGLRDEVLGLDERYDVLAQYRRLGQKSPNQVVHTHGYTEWFDVALERGKPVENLSPADLDEVRDRVVERIRTHTRRQRSAIPKLSGVKLVRNPRDAFAAVKAALTAPVSKPSGGKPSGGGRPGGVRSGGGQSRQGKPRRGPSLADPVRKTGEGRGQPIVGCPGPSRAQRLTCPCPAPYSSS